LGSRLSYRPISTKSAIERKAAPRDSGEPSSSGGSGRQFRSRHLNDTGGKLNHQDSLAHIPRRRSQASQNYQIEHDASGPAATESCPLALLQRWQTMARLVGSSNVPLRVCDRM